MPVFVTNLPDGIWTRKEFGEVVPPQSETAIADEALSGGRVVRTSSIGHVVYARPPELEARAPFGLTANAAAPGTDVEVMYGGPVEDPLWSWTPGEAVMLGPVGTLTQIQPPGPYVVVVGIALTSTILYLRIGAPTLTP